MHIAVGEIQVGPGSTSIYTAFHVVSSGGTNQTAEAYLDADATPAQMLDTIATVARDTCRGNSEDINVDAPVTIFGTIVQVS